MVRQAGNGHERDGDGATRAINGLIQERVAGKISRRQLIRRATELGVAAPVVGVMLHLTSDYAFGAPMSGGGAVRGVRLAGQTVPADAPTKPGGQAQQGGTLVTGSTEEFDTLNPYVSSLEVTGDLISAIMDALLVYDSKEQLHPQLATELPTVSADGLTYTFKLRQGVKFHNGDPFTAQDVINTWKMIMNKDFGASSQVGWDKVSDITAPDDSTVVMKTKEVYAPFISYVATGMGNGVIAPSKEMAKGADNFKQNFGQHPIGTGPMRFIEWKHKDHVTIERNPDYWGDKAKLDKIITQNIPNSATIVVQLKTGEIQMAGVGSDSVDEVLGNDKLNVIESTTQAWQHLDLKNISFIRDPRVRQALDFATPSALIIEKLLKGRALPCVADQVPGSWAYNPNIKPRPYDLDQAKKLLDEAGLKPGKDGVREKDGQKLEIQLWGISGSTLAQEILQVVAKSWQQVGVKTSLNFQDTSSLFGPEGYQWTDKMTAALYAWFNGNDPDDMYYWHSSQIPSSPTGAGGNGVAFFYKFNFQDKIDDLTSRAAKTVDQNQRKQLYWQIQELLHDQVPVIFIYWNKGFTAATKQLGGFWPSAFSRTYWNVQDWYLTK